LTNETLAALAIEVIEKFVTQLRFLDFIAAALAMAEYVLTYGNLPPRRAPFHRVRKPFLARKNDLHIHYEAARFTGKADVARHH